MTTTRTIGTTGRDYSTIEAWIAGLPADLVADGNSQIGQIFLDGNPFAPATGLSISGHTTDATHTITLTTGAGQSFRDNANKLTNALRYNTANGVAIEIGGFSFIISDANVTISNLQINHMSGGLHSDTGATSFQLNNCIVQNGSGYTPVGQFAENGGIVRNTLFISINDGYIVRTSAGTTSFYFCNFVWPSDANNDPNVVEFFVNVSGSVVACENCAFFNGTPGNMIDVIDTRTGSTFTNCMTDFNFGASPITGFTGGLTYSSQFENTTQAAADWRILSTADLKGGGTADSSNGATDIVGTARPQAGSWDVGVWEFSVAAPPPSGWPTNDVIVFAGGPPP